jgi:hypothetical protein
VPIQTGSSHDAPVEIEHGGQLWTVRDAVITHPMNQAVKRSTASTRARLTAIPKPNE